MKNSADLGGYNTLLVLQNSSYPTQPHSIIAKYHTPEQRKTSKCTKGKIEP